VREHSQYVPRVRVFTNLMHLTNQIPPSNLIHLANEIQLAKHLANQILLANEKHLVDPTLIESL